MAPVNLGNHIRNVLIKAEPPVPTVALCPFPDVLAKLKAGASVCIKVSAAHDLPYPFAVSTGFLTTVIAELCAARSDVRITVTEGGVGDRSVCEVARLRGLMDLNGATFADAESGEDVWVPNPLEAPFKQDGFWLPRFWVEAEARLLVTTCKLRSHHFQRWYSGGVRNLIGLLPRSRYRLPTSRRDMRSEVHQKGMDAMAADLYFTTGCNVPTVLDCRLLGRDDEHVPLRFTRTVDRVVVANDPAEADNRMVDILDLPFVPPYLAMIESRSNPQSRS